MFCTFYRPRFITSVFVFSRISNSTREEESTIGGLNTALRNAGKPTKNRFFGTESALIRMLTASEGGNFKESMWHDAASYLCFFGLHALIVYVLIKGITVLT